MNRNSHQQQHDQQQSMGKKNLISSGRYLHDQAIAMAILKVLTWPRIAVRHESKMWQRPQQMKYS